MGRLAQTLGVTNKPLFTTTTAETKAQTLAGANPSGAVQITSISLFPRSVSRGEFIILCRLIHCSFTSASKLQHESWVSRQPETLLCFVQDEKLQAATYAASASHMFTSRPMKLVVGLALRASVLRRAVSLSARPVKHRAIVRSLRAAQTRCASWQGLRTWPEKLNNSTVPHLKCSAPKGQAVTPNHSLNRTHCGGPSFGL